ncbi:MAG TPA: PKD domain-containing protein [Thermoplasmata archaeon]|nr:PKD domain-containing protein [Thermoplasmata archaeon]
MILYNGTLLPGDSTSLNGARPIDAAYDNRTGKVFIANFDSNTVSVIAASTDQIVAVVPVGLGPVGEAVAPSLGYVFVVDSLSHNVSVVSDSTNKVVASIPLPAYSDQAAFDPRTGDVFISANASNSVLAISATNFSIVANVPVGQDPSGIVYDSTHDDVYVANSYSNNMSILSAGSMRVIATVPGLNGPSVVAYDPERGEVFVGDQGTNYLQVVNDTNFTVVASISVGLTPTGLAFDPLTGDIYSSLNAADEVRVVSDRNNTAFGAISVGPGPALLSYDETERAIVCPNAASDNVSIISTTTNTIIATVSVGSSPTEVAFDSVDRTLFVLDYRGKEADVVEPASLRITDRIPLPGWPGGIAFDPSKDEVFVTIVLSSSVIVISGKTDSIVSNVLVGYNPMGVVYDPHVHAVFVAGFGTTELFEIDDSNNSVVASVPLNLTPEQITYDAANGDLYVTSLEGYVIVISDAPETVRTTWYEGPDPSGIAADPLDGKVFITDEALQANQTGNLTVVLDSTNQVAFRIPVGDAPLSPIYAPTTGEVLTPNRVSNDLTVCSATSEAVLGDVSVGAGPDGVAIDNTSGVIYVADGQQGSLSTLIPHEISYSVSFQQTGLPVGTEWTVSLGDKNSNATTSTIVFSEPNGSFPFSVPRVLVGGNEYSPTFSQSSPVNVSGNPVTIEVTFAPLPPMVVEIAYSVGATHSCSFKPWTVSLSARVEHGTAPYNFTWYFGDGSSRAFGPNVNHTYESLGLSTVTLMVTDANQNHSSATKAVSGGGPSTCASYATTPWTDYAILLGVIVGAIGLVIVLARRRKRRGEPPLGPESVKRS